MSTDIIEMKGNIDVQIECGHLIVIVTGMYVSTKIIEITDTMMHKLIVDILLLPFNNRDCF